MATTPTPGSSSTTCRPSPDGDPIDTEFSDADRRAALTLDGSGSDAEFGVARDLHRQWGPRLPELFALCLPAAKRYGTRASFLYHALQYSRVNAAAVQLAVRCLNDKSRHVRFRAAALLAASQDRGALGALREAAASVPEDSRADMRAAIDAIESRNINFFQDRDHSGMVTWNPTIWTPDKS